MNEQLIDKLNEKYSDFLTKNEVQPNGGNMLTSYRQGMRDYVNHIWHPVTEPFDHEKTVVFSDGKNISGTMRFMINVEDFWLKDQAKKKGVHYTMWAYSEDLLPQPISDVTNI